MINVLYSIVPAICLMAGFYFGYKLGFKSKTDNVPDIKPKSPITYMKEQKKKKEAEKELEETKKWIQKIDNYRGEFNK